MPRGFSDQERQQIRERLLAAGRELLTIHGIKRVNVEDLTRAAGISKGAFYLFYDAKEELFFDVLAHFEAEYQANLLRVANQPAATPQQQIRAFLQQAFTLWRADPLFTRFDDGDFQYLLRNAPPARVAEFLQRDEQFVRRLLAQWQASGIVVNDPPGLLVNLLRTLFLVHVRAAEFDSDYYQPLIDLLLELVASHLSNASAHNP